jgi:hypothetical protein
MVFFWGLTLWFFHDLNHDLFLHVYRQALNASSQEVSTVIMHRMTSLTSLFHHYYNNIQQLQERGQDLGLGDMQNVTDEQLKDGNGFFATRMLLWLAKRLEAIEESLLFGMQISESVLAVLNITGYVISCIILWFSITVALVVLGVDVWLAHSAGNMFGGLLAVRLVVGGLLIVAIWAVSHYSYHYKKWNSGREILRSCFATATVTGWNTYAKLKFDIALAGRCQRAMARINHLDKKTGLSGG